MNLEGMLTFNSQQNMPDKEGGRGFQHGQEDQYGVRGVCVYRDWYKRLVHRLSTFEFLKIRNTTTLMSVLLRDIFLVLI
jgi:hypothetical protein